MDLLFTTKEHKVHTKGLRQAKSDTKEKWMIEKESQRDSIPIAPVPSGERIEKEDNAGGIEIQ